MLLLVNVLCCSVVQFESHFVKPVGFGELLIYT